MLRRRVKFYRLVWLKYDLPASVSVFLVALPLCLGIALASGAPLYSGLLSGIIGGVLVSWLSGSQLAVSGPAAGLTTLVAISISTTGSFQVFLLSVIVAGIFQVLLGTLRWGSIANYFPSSVIRGMLAAIGLMLIFRQIPILIGYEKPDFWRTSLLHTFSAETFQTKYQALNQSISGITILISILALSVLIFFKNPLTPLITVIVGLIVNLACQRFFQSSSVSHAQLVNIPRDLFATVSFPDFTRIFHSSDIWQNGILIALLASLETLLCIEAIDKLDRHNRVTPVNRELVAQGIGNIVCGFLGAIPMTAVVVRGAANIEAGARTRLSSFTHGVFLLLAVIFIPFLLNMIPLATLGCILIVTGYNLTRPSLFIDQWRLGWKQFAPFVITIGVILATDLLIGVSIGLLISIYFIIRDNFKPQYKVERTHVNDQATYCIRLDRSVTFLNKVSLRSELNKMPPYSKVIIDGLHSEFIDHDILEIISEFETRARDKFINVELQGVQKVHLVASH